jgi:phosphate transport system substrate-binding protein
MQNSNRKRLMKTGLGLRNLTSVHQSHIQFGRRLTALTGIALLLALLPATFAQDRIVLVGSGSSVPAPLYAKWAQEYNRRHPTALLKYLPIGTSAGIKQIAHGSGDFGAGEAPLTAKERAGGKLIELPTVLIGIVPIYNLPEVHKELRFSGELLAGIFLGRVKTWDAPQVAKLNPGVKLPDLPIKVIYRPAGKGTNYIFSDFLSKTSAQFHSEIGVSPSPKWPVGTPAERSSDMADKVRETVGSIGYVESQYAVEGKIPFGLVQNASGHFVKASQKTITAACQGVEEPDWNKFSGSLTNASGDDSFPITSFSWLYLRTGGTDRTRAAALVDLLRWMYSDGQRIAAAEGYSELPRPLLAKIKDKVDTLR